MEYRSLGRSGIRLSVIGFGCGGNARLMVGDDEALRLATLQRALDAGINYFDTAAAYGGGTSEINLGRDLRTLGAHPVISTKVVLQADDLSDPCAAVLRNFDDGMQRLGLEDVDILVLHNRIFEQQQEGDFGVGAKVSLPDMFGRKGIVEAFEQLLGSGRTKVVGFTALGGDPAAITKVIECGVFGALNASFNLLNPSAAVRAPAGFPDADYGEVIPEAAAAGLGVMAIQVLARGELTGHGPADRRAAQVAAASLEPDEPLPSAAIRYVLSEPAVSTAILGLSEPRHVDDAAAAAARGPLSEATVRAIEAAAWQS